MTTAEVRQWLDRIGKDRFWLGDEMGISKRTLDNWFSADNFPIYAQKHIGLIMRQHSNPLDFQLSLEDFKRFQEAMRAAGYSEEREFARAIIRQHIADSGPKK